ncbi:MAG: hypothetical protein QM724_14285 [Flavobacteriales bacterium]
MPEALLAAGYAALFLYVIRRWGFFTAPGLPRRTIGALFLLKIAAGTLLWYIYTYHYTDRATADIYKYFDDGNVLFRALSSDHPVDYARMLFGVDNRAVHLNTDYYMVMNNWYRQYEGNLYNDAHTLIRFNAFVRLFSFGVYHVHTVFACFLGLIGLTALYKAFVPYLAGAERALTVSIFLLPSVLFWGSGVDQGDAVVLRPGRVRVAGVPLDRWPAAAVGPDGARAERGAAQRAEVLRASEPGPRTAGLRLVPVDEEQAGAPEVHDRARCDPLLRGMLAVVHPRLRCAGDPVDEAARLHRRGAVHAFGQLHPRP